MACERCGMCSRWMWVCEDRFGDMQGVCSLALERESGGLRLPVETLAWARAHLVGAWRRACDEWEAARDGE
nr:MAG TPA: hypothetical protein [Caudoviricetes sp.]